MKMEGVNILLVEDDANLGYVIKDNLEQQGFAVQWSSDGVQGLEAFQQHTFHICLLDVMMPRQDGFSLAEKIRAQNQDVPIIFLTAKSLKEDKIHAFNLGADDYITKPFSMEELLLRIQVFLKRTGRQEGRSNGLFSIGNLVFDYPNLCLRDHNQTRKLTQKQAELLKMLCLNMNRVLKREDLLNQVWGTDDYFAGRSMDVFISKLRKYLAADPNVEIENYHGSGFKIVVREEKKQSGKS